MKKIVALVLSLVMVLGLATTAFAAADKYDLYLADDGMATQMKIGAPGTGDKNDVTIDEVGAKVFKDGSGRVAYLKLSGGEYAVKTTAPTVSSFAVCEDGKTDILYYVNVVAGAGEASFMYKEEVKATTDFGKKCGQFDITPTAGVTYFTDVKGDLYWAGITPSSTDYTKNYLLNGVVVLGTFDKAATNHTFTTAANKYDNTTKLVVPTLARCTNPFCGYETSAIYLKGTAPAGSTVYTLDGTYEVALGAAAPSAPVVDGEKVESAETFDAGIAMYVGMSVMAAAGSAVVLKKKD